MKIWHTTKLDSVLRRCSVPALTLGLSAQPTRSLTSLLESEKRFGTTTERDPTQRRHDYRYFSRGSYFVLVEDIRQELATIAAHEYIFIRTVEGEEKGSWPVAYCHPLSRNPFIPYDLKEERRRERMERAEKQREEERAAEVKRIRAHQIHQRKQNDLRRSVSLSNLHRSFKVDHCDMLEPAFRDDHGASGFDSNAYIAASGNSMSIASTFGTTSTMGAGSSTMSGLGIGNRLLRNGTLPAEVTTSRRVGTQEPSRSTSFSKASASSAMMPPPEIPDRSRNLLRKCKSTNTLRQPKRDERAKPGYCESCKQKFEDFKVVSFEHNYSLLCLNVFSSMSEGAVIRSLPTMSQISSSSTLLSVGYAERRRPRLRWKKLNSSTNVPCRNSHPFLALPTPQTKRCLFFLPRATRCPMSKWPRMGLNMSIWTMTKTTLCNLWVIAFIYFSFTFPPSLSL